MAKYLDRDLDVSKNRIFSRKPRLNTSRTGVLVNPTQHLLLKLGAYSDLVDKYQQEYGQVCICCGSKIENIMTDKLFILMMRDGGNQKIPDEMIKELCPTCDYEMKKQFNGSLYQGDLLAFIEKSMDYNHITQNWLDLQVEEEIVSNFRDEKELCQETRELYVKWALKNKVDIW